MDAFSEELGFGDYKYQAINLLKKTIDILNEFEVNHFLISGTLLGYIRHNDFIPWDDDIDLIVDSSFLKKIDIIAEKYSEMSIFFKSKYDAIKICYENSLIIGDKNWDSCAIKTNNPTNKTLNFPFVDMFIYESGYGAHICGVYKKIKIDGKVRDMFMPFSGPCARCFRYINEHEMVFFHNDWLKSDFFPPQKVNFLGIECNIPKNPHKFLKNNFGVDYMSEIKSPERHHRINKDIKEIYVKDYVRK